MDKPILFLVDDEPEVLASVAAALERTDTSCTSALERLERGRDRDQEVALLVTDQGMPEMTRLFASFEARTVLTGH